MLWCGVDFETTGLEAGKDRITEIGAVLWDVEAKKPLRIINELVSDGEGNGDISEEITEITGITGDMCTEYGYPAKPLLQNLYAIMARADYIVAHNAPFDKGFYLAECEKHDVVVAERHWIDTTEDIDFPAAVSKHGRALEVLGPKHGFLNPFSHRAVFDVLAMLRVASNYDPNQIVKWALTPTITVRAQVTYHDREKAKAQGFRWDGDRKWWLRNIKEFQRDEVTKICEDAGFCIEEVEIPS